VFTVVASTWRLLLLLLLLLLQCCDVV
jgi:hypothetical protein